MRTYDLFTFQDELKEMAREFNNEFLCVSHKLRAEAGYAADRKAEARIRSIVSRFSGLSSDYEAFIAHTEQLLVELWSTTINGCPSMHMNDRRILPVERKLRHLKDDRIRNALPVEITIPVGAKIGFFSKRVTEEEHVYQVLFFSDRWMIQTGCYNLAERKWVKALPVRPIYGRQFRVEDDQYWSKDGYVQAVQDELIDHCLPAVTGSFLRFFGREEARKLLLRADGND
jgi:hypothetical protein